MGTRRIAQAVSRWKHGTTGRLRRDYLQDNLALFDRIEFSEKRIEISPGHGVTAVNRGIDLVRRVDTGETTVVELKSSDGTQPEEMTDAQLHVYALGYEERTERRPDYLEVYEFDTLRESSRSKRVSSERTRKARKLRKLKKDGVDAWVGSGQAREKDESEGV